MLRRRGAQSVAHVNLTAKGFNKKFVHPSLISQLGWPLIKALLLRGCTSAFVLAQVRKALHDTLPLLTGIFSRIM